MDLDSLLSGDRVVYTFIMAWVLCGVVWVGLDWLGNPNRGSFRPKGDQYFGTRRERREARRLKRAEDDAAVRSTLRDAYGASSLRVLWNKRREAEVISADELLVRGDPLPPRRRRRRLSRIPELDDHAPLLRPEAMLATYDEHQPPTLPMPLPRGRWRVGGNPLMLNRKGGEPSVATIRSRVWKNRAGESVWGEPNQARMREGKAPRRRNPVSGRIETATVDHTTAIHHWRSDAVDPFAPEREPVS